MNKVYKNSREACADIKSGASILLGGFGLSGIPENCLRAIRAMGIKNLTLITNNAGVDDWGTGVLLQDHQLSKVISSYIGENSEIERQFLHGELEVELVPQGTLAEAIRAGGAGIPAFYTATGVGTGVSDGGLPMMHDKNGNVIKVSEPKDMRVFDGRLYVMERSITADYALVKAWKGDKLGNLVYRRTAKNFNPMMATAGKITIAEVEELVEVGELDPDNVHTPSAYVQRIFQGEFFERRIEKRTVRQA